MKCYDCNVKDGKKRKDRGAHTGTVKKCSDCGKRRVILSDIHWVSAYPNGMMCQ